MGGNLNLKWGLQKYFSLSSTSLLPKIGASTVNTIAWNPLFSAYFTSFWVRFLSLYDDFNIIIHTFRYRVTSF